MSEFIVAPPISLSRQERSPRSLVYPLVLLCSLFNQSPWGSAQSPAAAQPGTGATSTDAKDARVADIESRLTEVTKTLIQTQRALQNSMQEIEQLQKELNALRPQTSLAQPEAETKPAPPIASTPADVASKNDIKALQEEQDAIQAEVKQHDQIKVETASKYPLRISGLVLFNAYSNAGVVDNSELPGLALPRNPGSSHGSTGATLRQTMLALEANGPRLAGARSSGSVSIDFFGGTTANSLGYSYSPGYVRMRQAQVSLDWENTSVRAGYTIPLISPLSPTSYASIAQPALSGSGNLWTWSPQLSVEQRVHLANQTGLKFEAGLITPPSPGYTSVQLNSPVEASRRPGYEGRLSFQAGADSTSARPFVFGVGAYSANQFYSSSAQVHAWAVTGDWQVPISRWFDFTGEFYRGRALGGLGGGAYKDALVGTDSITGLSRTVGVETAGGWGQLKLRLRPTLEINGMFGLDDAFASNFDGLTFPSTSTPLQAYTRNRTVGGNLIYRPKTYLILSPEYKRIQSWRYTGPPNITDVFTLSAGFQF